MVAADCLHPSPDLLRRARTLAQRAARAGGDAALRQFRRPGLAVESKADGTPVSAADREAEAAVREVLGADPDLGGCDVLGEELGPCGGGSPLRWVVDPVDGTLQFVRGIPLWGTLVALEDVGRGQPLVGVLHFPALGTTYAAARGLGATRDGRPFVQSPLPPDAEPVLHVPDPVAFRRHRRPAELAALQARFVHVRGYFDCFGHALAAEGAFGLALDLGLRPWDLAASVVLVEEAGGEVRCRPSREQGCRDVLLGAPGLVAELAPSLGF